MAAQSNQPLKPDDEILGYKLKHRLGSGGYGEVWAAEAPGGLVKAVKFIYGFHDEQRAQAELKALGRIKQLRHPFLISLERIDIVDQRLVIISELADNCLRECFLNHHRKTGTGIPRDDLLQYLSNVADALDYMAVEHSLQHLDIKPENLLMVGKHVKVADFGLVKNVHEINQSMMDGLTPTYASPELFDGKPSRHSDQYSLAIVYYELLTGTRPFTGSTAAQLARQHVGSRPRLDALPVSDQAVIARALAKESGKRYPSCRSLVDDLLRRKVKQKLRRNSVMPDSCSTSSDTIQVQNGQFANESQTQQLTTGSLSGIQSVAEELEKLSAFDLSELKSTVRPTVFIGIGKTGGRILRKIKSHISTKVGSEDVVPSIKFLYMDTDRKAIFDSTVSGPRVAAMTASETIELKLKSREEYRSSSKDFSWLSRRWLFNVPRTLQTEGMRPLGRLALADHFDEVYQKLSDTIRAALEEERLATTSETLKMDPFQGPPRIVIVSSSAGGIGSGTTLDVTHAIRTILSEEGVLEENEDILGVMLHSSQADSAKEQLAIANTYSFLSEYNHYCLHGYRGDSTIDLPQFDPGPIFSNLYFKHIGVNLSESNHEKALDEVAFYLYLGTATPCTGFFDKSREASEASGLMLQSMGLTSSVGGLEGAVGRTRMVLAENLVEYWKSQCGIKEEKVLDELTQLILKQAGFQTHIIQNTLTEQEYTEWPDGILQHAQEELQDLIQTAEQNEHDGVWVLQNFNARLELLSGDNEQAEEVNLYDTVLRSVRGIASDLSTKIESQILKLFDFPVIRAAGANQVCGHVAQVMINYSATLENQIQRQTTARHQLINHLASAENIKELDLKNPESLALMNQIATLRFQIVTLQTSIKLVEAVLGNLEVTARKIRELSQQLELVNESFRESFGSSNLDQDLVGGESLDLLGEKIILALEDKFSKLVPLVDEEFNKTDMEGFSGLLEMVDDRSAWLRTLPRLILRCCRQLIVNEVNKIEVDSAIQESKVTQRQFEDWIEMKVAEAQPSLQNCGGAVRLLLGLPESSSESPIIEMIAGKAQLEPTVFNAIPGDCVICYEVSDIPLDNIAVALIESHMDCAELIQRLHCRSDIEWTGLTQTV